MKPQQDDNPDPRLPPLSEQLRKYGPLFLVGMVIGLLGSPALWVLAAFAAAFYWLIWRV